MSSHMVWPGGFVKTNYASKKFKVDLVCAICRRETCGTVWHHLATGRSVCTHCLSDPWVNGIEIGEAL